MAKKKYDPLWEVIGEKNPLQGTAPCIDAVCPWCRVTVHLGNNVAARETYECGLCGALSSVAIEGGRPTLQRVE